MKIGEFEIGSSRAFIIAEIGNNHNGDFDRAVTLIDIAKSAGADCAKFQMRHLDEVYRRRSLEKSGDDLGAEYIIDLLNRFELTVAQHEKLSAYCRQIGILYLCTPWDAKSIEVLERFGVLAYKVASADLTNLPLLDLLACTKKPLILSTGMSGLEEVKTTMNFLRSRECEFALLHCNSTYPAPLQDINLRWMNSLRDMHSLIGYSGHERGIEVSLAAAALGACVIERHLTLDRCMEGPDHAASLTNQEFSAMVKGIRNIEEALGSGQKRVMSQGEVINRENLGKSLVAATALTKGLVLKSEHIKVCSPGQGLSPQNYDKLVGHTLNRDMLAEDFFFESDLSGNLIEPRSYEFRRPWGIPIRFHDFQEYAERVCPDIWEFHLSYSDMDLPVSDYLLGEYTSDFVVHAPELFSQSRLMDLASTDPGYRAQSLLETQRVIDVTRSLKTFFPKTVRPLIVANVGGFSMDYPLSDREKDLRYEIFAESLSKLDLDGVELIPQTMAPFPWHFGGQRYQNIFVHIDEILAWCDKLSIRMCFDISHSKLTCNRFGSDFYDFASKIAPITAHLHLGDAKGINGEGLQVGTGEIDFDRLSKILNEGCPEASFIPEIWQGHKNGGQGFWKALNYLEKKL